MALSQRTQLPRRVKDIGGQVFGTLKVIQYLGCHDISRAYWRCLCECGNERVVRGDDLRCGYVKHCGCRRGEPCADEEERQRRARDARNQKLYRQRHLEKVKARDRERNQSQYEKKKDAICERMRQLYRDDPEKFIKKSRRYDREKRLVLGELYERDKGCRICGHDLGETGQKGAHLDHCHRTGKIRGFLCRTCNLGLGYFKDDPELLRKAARYLKKYGY